MHSQGITHTDLKPENILLTDTPDTEQHTKVMNIADPSVKVIDFGNSTWDHENHRALICTQ